MDHPLLATHSEFSDPDALGIAELVPAKRSGALSPVSLTEACLDRIARYAHAPHCFIAVAGWTTRAPIPHSGASA